MRSGRAANTASSRSRAITARRGASSRPVRKAACSRSRSPDGQWYSRAQTGVEVDLEAIALLADGTLVVVGDRGQILISRDDARTWKSLPNDLGLAHLWSVERFGPGLLIGGDEGLVVKL